MVAVEIILAIPFKGTAKALDDADARLPTQMLARLGDTETGRAADQGHGVACQVRRAAQADHAANHFRQKSSPIGQPIGHAPADAWPFQFLHEEIEEILLRDLAFATEVISLAFGSRMIGGANGTLGHVAGIDNVQQVVAATNDGNSASVQGLEEARQGRAVAGTVDPAGPDNRQLAEILPA